MYRPTTLEKRAQVRVEIEKNLLKRVQSAGKTFSFNDKHDKTKPLDIFFQDTHEGLVLFIIYFTQACRYMVCQGCELPNTSSLHYVNTRAIMAQTRHVFEERSDVCAVLRDIKKVIVSNQGSVLDQETFSTAALGHLVAKCVEHLPNMEVLTLETRAEYVEKPELLMLAQALQDGETPATLELAVGLEMFDKEKRNHVFRKGLSNDTLQNLAKELAVYDFRLKLYLMFKPIPGLTDEEAIEDIREAIIYLSDLQSRIPGSHISIHLNPTYAARGTPLETAFIEGRYTPAYLSDVVRAIRFGVGRGVPIFIGMNDENLAVEGGSFIRPGDEHLLPILNQFNKTQDYSLLNRLPG